MIYLQIILFFIGIGLTPPVLRDYLVGVLHDEVISLFMHMLWTVCWTAFITISFLL